MACYLAIFIYHRCLISSLKQNVESITKLPMHIRHITVYEIQFIYHRRCDLDFKPNVESTTKLRMHIRNITIC